MKNKIVMITGATSGIGLVSARTIAQKGAHLILVARNENKAAALVQKLKTETNNKNIEYIIADFSLMSEVRKCAEEFKKRQYYRLDVLINNIGMINDKRTITAEGFEKTMATNHLSWFLLTQLLLVQLKSSPAARIVNVASEAHKFGTLHFDNINQEKKYGTWSAYANSKTAMIACTYELAKQLKKTKITINALHPGVIKTAFGKGMKRSFLVKVAEFFMRKISPEEGAKTQIYLASSPEVEGVTGKYWNEHAQQKNSNSQTRDETFAKQIYDWSIEQVGLEAMPKALLKK